MRKAQRGPAGPCLPTNSKSRRASCCRLVGFRLQIVHPVPQTWDERQETRGKRRCSHSSAGPSPSTVILRAHDSGTGGRTARGGCFPFPMWWRDGDISGRSAVARRGDMCSSALPQKPHTHQSDSHTRALRGARIGCFPRDIAGSREHCLAKRGGVWHAHVTGIFGNAPPEKACFSGH